MDRSNRLPAAVIAGGLVLAALTGCGGEQTVASKSAAAFREAQKRGQTFGGEGHGHGTVTSGGGTGEHEDRPGEEAAEGTAPGHEHAGAEAPAGGEMRHDGGHDGMAHPGAAPGPAGERKTGGHAAMEHGQSPAASGGRGGHATMQHGGHPAVPSGPTPGVREDTGQAGQHAGHGAMQRKAPAAGRPPAGHAGHAPTPAGMPAASPVPEPVAAPAGQPAATLLPDALDAPAATSVVDAQRSAEMALEMTGGGHGAHGAGTYHQLDAGRETLPPAPPERQEDKEHDHEPPASVGWAAGERRRT